MAFITVRIEGSIFTADILDKVAAGELKGQSPTDFNIKPGLKVKDEIANAWADAQALWHIFKRQLDRIPQNASGASETRKFWMIPFLGLLGFDVQFSPKADIVEKQTYDISHKAANLSGFPLHIMGVNDCLDKKRDTGGPRLSPHALVQEYLNLTEHLYAIVSNGFSLRLLRDSTRLVKLSFIEFDLRSMMEDEHFADFAMMFRLLHASRMPSVPGAGPDSLIESYHQDSLDSGARIREGLSRAVEDSVKGLADGFLNHPDNHKLRESFPEPIQDAGPLYQHLLRLIYRLLFLMVIEERHLIYKKDDKNDKDAESRLADIYYSYYSVSQLRKRCEALTISREKHADLWIALSHTFRLFEDNEKGAFLGIKPLSGQLFHPEAIGILADCKLDNRVLLTAMECLSLFRHKDSGQKIRVNYGSLNVEEFGSVYEGLLEYTPLVQRSNHRFQFMFKRGTERSASGSHYTPEELVQPLIRHSLDHVIEGVIKSFDQTFSKVWPPAGSPKVKPEAGPSEIEKALLSIKVCDAACGSGHILLSAARRIGTELAKVRTGEDQPSPTALREGIRDAVSHCIYGVDKNPLAVELCKVALWLEAHTPGMPLHFLDHRIKCGDAIVGLAHKEELEQGIPDEAFKRLPGDDPDVVRELAQRNRKERTEMLRVLKDYSQAYEPMNNITLLFRRIDALPERTAAEIAHKEEEYKKLVSGTHWRRMKSLADLLTAPFFLPKTPDYAGAIITDADYRQYVKGFENVSPAQLQAAASQSQERRFFHWFLEFPDVFASGGFDCILGNPPYLGVSKISGNYGYYYLNYINSLYAPTRGCDLVTYFLRRDFDLIKQQSFIALITTNSIAEGRNREGGLEVIIHQGGTINFAYKSIRWPGIANLYVSLLGLFKGTFTGPKTLDNRPVDYISSFFEDSQDIGTPFTLRQNQHKMFQGSKFMGEGFLLIPAEKERLIAVDARNNEVIFPVLNGRDVNDKYDQTPERYIINFFDWSEERAQTYPEPYRIVKEKVKPVREKDNRKLYRERWWMYAEHRPGLYRAISKIKKCFIASQTTKYLNFSLYLNKVVFTQSLFVYANDKFSSYAALQSTLHNEWARKYSSKLKMDLSYTPSKCFETFPFPQDLTQEMEAELERIGEEYHEFRRQSMLGLELGLTKIYNLFHKRDLSVEDVIHVIRESGKEIAAAETAFRDIKRLRDMHRQMDEAVLRAYNWGDIGLAHGFYEVDYLPENDRVRYTISPEARKEILKRLLLLNHQVHAREQEETPVPPVAKPKKTKNTARSIAAPEQKSLF